MPFLLFESLATGEEGSGHPVIDSVDLIEGDNKGSFPLSQQLNGLLGLIFNRMHDIDHKNSHITERRAS